MSEEHTILVSRAEAAAAAAAESAEKTAADRGRVEQLISDIDTEKIPQLKASKEALRLAISGKGQSIAESDPISEYASRVSDINNFVTATAEDILKDRVGADVNGNPVYGSIPTVNPTLSGNVVTVPKGYISEEQTLTVGTASGMDELEFFDWMTILNQQ